MTRKRQKDIPTPRVGDRVVSVSLFGRMGQHGRRVEGFTDPARRMVWVEWDDGTLEGEFLESLVREVDYPKTHAYRILKEIEEDRRRAGGGF